MNPIQKLRYRLAAALSPREMTRTYHKPNINSNYEFNKPYNPDELKVRDYDEMLRDPQVKSGFELIRQFLLTRSLQVTPASDEEEDVAVADFIRKMLYNMEYPLRKVLNDIYTGIVYGYSVLEIIWDTNEDDQLIIKRLDPLHIDTLEDCFLYNDEGELETIKQTPLTGDVVEIPAEKCLVYTYNERFRDRSGESILDTVYDNWYDKQRIINWWNIFLQKHEGPTLVGYVDNPALKDAMREQLEQVQEGRTQLTAGVGDRIEILESSHRGEGFLEAIKYHDTMIFRKMNIGTMILGQEDGKGAYAQSITQEAVLSRFLDGVHQDIAAELETLVRRVVDYNFNVEAYPNISFTTFEDKDELTLLERLKPLVDNYAINPSSGWFQELLKVVVEKHSDLTVENQEEQAPDEVIVPSTEDVNTPMEPTEFLNEVRDVITPREEK